MFGKRPGTETQAPRQAPPPAAGAAIATRPQPMAAKSGEVAAKAGAPILEKPLMGETLISAIHGLLAK